FARRLTVCRMFACVDPCLRSATPQGSETLKGTSPQGRGVALSKYRFPLDRHSPLWRLFGGGDPRSNLGFLFGGGRPALANGSRLADTDFSQAALHGVLSALQ